MIQANNLFILYCLCSANQNPGSNEPARVILLPIGKLLFLLFWFFSIMHDSNFFVLFDKIFFYWMVLLVNPVKMCLHHPCKWCFRILQSWCMHLKLVFGFVFLHSPFQWVCQTSTLLPTQPCWIFFQFVSFFFFSNLESWKLGLNLVDLFLFGLSLQWSCRTYTF